MRLMTWNCRGGGFRHKAKHIAPYRPNVLAVQEVEPIAKVGPFDGELQPTYRDRVTDPKWDRRGIGVFSYAHTALQAIDAPDPANEFRRYEACCGATRFQIVAAWARGPKYRQVHEGLIRHADSIRQWPTVVMGDFNDNKSWGSNFQTLLDVIGSLRLVSAYHRYFSEAFGEETRKTYFDTRNLNGRAATKAHHIDYCFIPEAWIQRLRYVEVGRFEDWHKVSDHMPLIVDVDLPGVGAS